MNNLDYNNMVGWYGDVPQGLNTKSDFEEILKRLPPNPHILEIGVFVGISLINICSRCINPTAVAIDNWQLSQQEHQYDKNIKETLISNLEKANLTKSVEIIDGNSANILQNLPLNSFDFIYIDGSHMCLDVLSDIILSWRLLKIKGILAIDDVKWEYDPFHPLKSPFDAVLWFERNYSSQYKLLKYNYRMFVEKLEKKNLELEVSPFYV